MQNLNITAKFLLLLIPSLGVVGLAFVSVLLYFEHDRLKNELAQKMDLIADMHALAIAEPLWTLNDESMERNLNTISTHSEVRCVEVREPSGELKKSAPYDAGCDAADATDSLAKSLSFHDEQVGVLVIYYTSDSINKQLWDSAALAIWLLLLSLAVTVLVALLALRYIIGKPLGRLLQSIRGADASGEREQVPWHSRDELGTVISAYNAMIANIDERTRELDQARSQAEDATRSKSRFLATMSHELRTPLNAIIGISEIVLEDVRERRLDEFIEPLERVVRAGKHLLSLINDILDLSKIEAGKLELQNEWVDIAAAVAEAAATTESLAAQNDNRLNLQISDDIGAMYTDPVRFRQIVLNLLSNACKFTEDGLVTITAKQQTNNGANWIRITVTDTGIGMDGDTQKRIFSEFAQGASTLHNKHSGTGLGLAICRRLCELMSGRIQVSSELGKGTSFTFELPADNHAASSGPEHDTQ